MAIAGPIQEQSLAVHQLGYAGRVESASLLATPTSFDGPITMESLEALQAGFAGPIGEEGLETLPGASLGPSFDHLALAAPTTTTGPVASSLIVGEPSGTGTVYDHEAIEAPASTTGPSFDHTVLAVIPPDWVFGPIDDGYASAGGLTSVGPVVDGSSNLPPALTVNDPDVVVAAPVRNKLSDGEVSFKSPGTYGLERDPVTGKITGSKF